MGRIVRATEGQTVYNRTSLSQEVYYCTSMYFLRYTGYWILEEYFSYTYHESSNYYCYIGDVYLCEFEHLLETKSKLLVNHEDCNQTVKHAARRLVPANLIIYSLYSCKIL